MQSVTQSRQRSKGRRGAAAARRFSPASKMDQLKEAFMMGLISKSEYVNMGGVVPEEEKPKDGQVKCPTCTFLNPRGSTECSMCGTALAAPLSAPEPLPGPPPLSELPKPVPRIPPPPPPPGAMPRGAPMGGPPMGGPPGAPPGGASTNRADKEKIKELEWQTMELQQQLRKSEENSSRIERELRSSKQKLAGVEKELRTVGTKDREIAALSRKVAEIGEHLRETQEASIEHFIAAECISGKDVHALWEPLRFPALKLNETGRELGQRGAIQFSRGHAVELTGLNRRGDLNGQRGVVVEFSSGRYTVELPSGNMSVHARNLIDKADTSPMKGQKQALVKAITAELNAHRNTRMQMEKLQEELAYAKQDLDSAQSEIRELKNSKSSGNAPPSPPGIPAAVVRKMADLKKQLDQANQKIMLDGTQIEKLRTELQAATATPSLGGGLMADLKKQLDQANQKIMLDGAQIEKLRTELQAAPGLPRGRPPPPGPPGAIATPSLGGGLWSTSRPKPKPVSDSMITALAARCFDLGLGVRQDKDAAKALYALLERAELRGMTQESADGAFLMAEMLDFERNKDAASGQRATAVSLYATAAEAGHPSAQNALGNCFEMGEGVAQDFASAVEWYAKAGDQGHPLALRNLAKLHEQGLGVPRDAATAQQLYASSILAL